MSKFRCQKKINATRNTEIIKEAISVVKGRIGDQLVQERVLNFFFFLILGGNDSSVIKWRE